MEVRNTNPTSLAVIGRALLLVRSHPHGSRVLSQLVRPEYITKSLSYAPGISTLLATILSPASLSVPRLVHSPAHVDVASKSLVFSKAVRLLYHGLTDLVVSRKWFVMLPCGKGA